jgi:hypothetical protein
VIERTLPARIGKEFNWHPDIDPDRKFERTVAVARLHDDVFAIYRPVDGWDVMSSSVWRQLFASPVPDFLSNFSWRWYRSLRWLDDSDGPAHESHDYGNTDLVAMSASSGLAWRQAYLAGLITQKTGLPRRLDNFGPEDLRPLHVRPLSMSQAEFTRAVHENLAGTDPYASVDASSIAIRVLVESEAPLRACA